MRIKAGLAASVALLLAGMSAQAAAPLTTPILTASPTEGSMSVGNEIWCYAVNVGTTVLQLTAEVVNVDTGAVADTETCSTAPGKTCSASTSCSGTLVCNAFCRFTGGSKKQVRGSIHLLPGVSGNTVVALPAQ
jgi:hypothetical protein